MSRGLLSSRLPPTERRQGADRRAGFLAGQDDRPRSERLRALLPDIWALVKPRRGTLLLGLLLMAINRVSGLALPASTKFLVDDVLGKKHVSLLLPLVLGVLGASLLKGATSLALTQVLSKSAQRMITELRIRVQRHVGRLPVAFYDSNQTGNLVSRVMNDVEGIRNLVGTGLVELVGGIMTAVIAFVVLVRISPLMTAIAFGTLLVFTVALNRAFHRIRPIFRERARINAEITGRLTESFGAVRTVKGFHAEARESDVFARGVERLLRNILTALTATSLLGLSTTLLLGIVAATVMFVGARQVLTGAMTLGSFFTYTAFLGFMAAPVLQIVATGTAFTEALAGLERTRELLRERREDEALERTRELGTIEGRVAFEDVSFAYEASGEVLREMSFEAPPGTVTALVGPSGSGKSTMISLLAAFHVPQKGVVRVDGVDLATVRLDHYRSQIGVVLQETFLFGGSIQENVAFSRPEARQEEILEACRTARVDEFAERFPQKLDTIVGERGIKLSGGQRQRVSIARAILANPRILILDEATSHLDSESEALIQEGLGRLMQGRTTFVIAHRLSTIRRADQILVIEEGRICESGTHEELYKLGGRYYELYTRQLGFEANLLLAAGEGDSVEEPAARSGSLDESAPESPLGLLRRPPG